MKLRNKNTGEIGKLHCDMNVSPAKYGVFEDTDIRGHYWEYDSLAELNAEWEDYTPKEPLIKDEKVRKAVRAWAEANGVGTVLYKEDNYRFYADDTEIGSMIEFENIPEYIGLRHEHRYTIAELCGEGEQRWYEFWSYSQVQEHVAKP